MYPMENYECNLIKDQKKICKSIFIILYSFKVSENDIQYWSVQINASSNIFLSRIYSDEENNLDVLCSGGSKWINFFTKLLYFQQNKTYMFYWGSL